MEENSAEGVEEGEGVEKDADDPARLVFLNALAMSTKPTIAPKFLQSPGSLGTQAMISVKSMIRQSPARLASMLQIPEPLADMKRKTKQ